MNIITLGFDLSYTATGVAMLDKFIQTDTWKHPAQLTGPERLEWFRAEVEDTVSRIKPTCVAVEGYAFGAKAQQHKLGELGGIVKHQLWVMGVDTLIVPPTSLKKFATGKGACPKGAVMVAVYKRWDYEAKDDNQADAIVLAHIARALSRDRGMDALTGAQQDAIKKIERIPGRKIVRTRTRAA